MARRNLEIKRTTLISLGCATFLCSVGIARVEPTGVILYAWPLILAATMTAVKFPVSSICLIMAIAFTGLWRGGVYKAQLDKYATLMGHKVVIELTASDDAVYGYGSQLKFTGDNVYVDGGRLAGQVQVSGFGINSVYEGDRLLVYGKFKPGYGSAQASVSYAQIKLIERNPSALSFVRRKFSTGIISALPEPLASFALGLLIGQRSNLPQNVKDDLKHVGLTHIIAVSGYNLTIILRATEKLFAKYSRRISLCAAIFLIFVFFAMTGGAASIVRASIVSMLSIMAAYYGRNFKSLNIILLAAAVTAFLNPFYLWSDLGWYLSFLAFTGVIVISPLLITRIRPLKEWSVLEMVAIETICAELMTLPLILYAFGEMTLVGLPSNLMIATLIPAAMIFSAIAGLAGLTGWVFAGWVAWPATIVLNFMLDLAHLIASMPHVFISNIDFGLIHMVVSYVSVAILGLVLHLKTKGVYSAKITDKNNNI